MKRSHLAAGLAAALVAAMAAVPVAAAPVVPPEARSGGLTAKTTLLTGDEVTVTDGRVRVRRGPGRENVSFRTYRDVHGHLHVVPLDVQARLNSGELDERLFDVSRLTGAAPAGTRARVSVRAEAESHDVKLTFLDHDGKPTPKHRGVRARVPVRSRPLPPGRATR